VLIERDLAKPLHIRHRLIHDKFVKATLTNLQLSTSKTHEYLMDVRYVFSYFSVLEFGSIDLYSIEKRYTLSELQGQQERAL
ncbi:MAG: hypothetical protein RR772_02185, partial [Gordonibacter sp.]